MSFRVESELKTNIEIPISRTDIQLQALKMTPKAEQIANFKLFVND